MSRIIKEYSNSIKDCESLELCNEAIQCMEGPLRRLSLIKSCNDDYDCREGGNSKLQWKPLNENWNPSILINAMKQYYQLKKHNQVDTKAVRTLPNEDVKHRDNKIERKNDDDLDRDFTNKKKSSTEECHDKTSTITPSDKSETVNITIHSRNNEGGRVTYGSKTRLKRKRHNPSTVKDVFHFGSSQSSSVSPPAYSHLTKKKAKQCYGKRRPNNHYQSPIVTTFPYANTATTDSNTTQQQQQMSQESDSFHKGLPEEFLPRQLESSFENVEMRLPVPKNNQTIESQESNTTYISKSHPNTLNHQNNISASQSVRENEEFESNDGLSNNQKEITTEIENQQNMQRGEQTHSTPKKQPKKQPNSIIKESDTKNQTNEKQTELMSQLTDQSDPSSKHERESNNTNSDTEQQEGMNLKSSTDDDHDDYDDSSQDELKSLFNEVNKSLCSQENHQRDSPIHDRSHSPPKFVRGSYRDAHQTKDSIENEKKSHTMHKCQDTALTQVENEDKDREPSTTVINNQPVQNISQKHDENDSDQETTLVVGSSVPLLDIADNKETSVCQTTTEPHGTDKKSKSTQFSQYFQDIPSSPSYDSFSQQSLHSEHPPPEFWIATRNINHDDELSPPESDTYCPTPPSDTDEDTLGSNRVGSRNVAMSPPFSCSQESLQSEHPPNIDFSYRNRQPLLVQGKNSMSDENDSYEKTLSISSPENKISSHPTPPSSIERSHTEDATYEESPMNETLEAHFRYLEEGTQHSVDTADNNNEEDHPTFRKEKELRDTKKSSILMNASCTNLKNTSIQESDTTVRKLDLSTEDSPTKSKDDDDTGSEHSMDILEVQETCPVIPESCPNHNSDILYQRNRKPLFDGETKSKQIPDNDVDMLMINETPLLPQPEHSLMDRPRSPLEVRPVFAETNDDFVPETIELISSKENESDDYQDRNSVEDLNDVKDDTLRKEKKIQSMNEIGINNSQSSHDVSTESSKQILENFTERPSYEQNSGDTIVEVKTNYQSKEEIIDDESTAINVNTDSNYKSGSSFCRYIVFDYLDSSELIALKKMVQTSNMYSLRHQIPVDEIERTIFVTHTLSDGEGLRHIQNLEYSKKYANLKNRQVHLKSFEYLKARILGVHVIQSTWLTSSAEKGYWQPENNFRVVNHPVRNNSPMTMRSKKNLHLRSLSDFSVLVIPTKEREKNLHFRKDCYIPKSTLGLRAGQIELLIQLLGGQILSSNSGYDPWGMKKYQRGKSSTTKIIISPDDMSLGDLNNLDTYSTTTNPIPHYSKFEKLAMIEEKKSMIIPANYDSKTDTVRVPVVMTSWLVDCISTKQLVHPTLSCCHGFMTWSMNEH